jgi:hypothetical protein
MIHHNTRDTVLLSGWLFADLLLGLMVIFLASIPGAQPVPPIIPSLSVTPSTLSPTDSACTGGTANPQCTLSVGETAASVGPVDWSASSDISDNIVFSPAKGTLSPGKTTQVVISSLPCQNGSFTFSGSRKASPVIVSWHCTKAAERLDFAPRRFQLSVDPNGLLNNSQGAIDDVKRQVGQVSFLNGRSVGLAVVYAGAPDQTATSQAANVSDKVYTVLKSLGQNGGPFQRASYYYDLYHLGNATNVVEVDVFLYLQ